MNIHDTMIQLPFRLSLAYVANIAMFLLALVVFKKRRENGFLALLVALGLQVIASIFSACYILLRPSGGLSPILMQAWSALTPIGSLISVFGWALLAIRKNEKHA